MTHENWKETAATVYSCELIGNTGRYDDGDPIYRLVFSYRVNDEYYSGEYNTNALYDKNEPLTIQYDPAHPAHNNLSDRQNTRRRIAIISFVFLFVCILVAAMLQGRN